jgi:SlyX protein
VTSEQRLIEIEIKLTRQEDLTQALGELVYAQQKKIDELQAICTALARRMGGVSGHTGADPYNDERPPHF